MFRVLATTATQLTYALEVTPSPLSASPDESQLGNVSLALTATNQTAAAISVSGISIAVSLGPNADDLSEVVGKLAVTVSPASVWTVTPPDTGPTTGPNAYTAVGPLDDDISVAPNDTVVLLVANVPVSTLIGTTPVTVTEYVNEWSSSASVEFDLPKYPVGFYFDTLGAFVPGTDPPTPVAQVPYNTQVQLYWNTSLTTVSPFSITFGTNAGPTPGVPNGPGSFLSPPLTSDTVFVVEATVTDDSGNSVGHALSVPVSVQSPDLVATSLTLAGQTIGSFGELLPKGSIVMWSGSATEIPVNWALCDGSNGTPNMLSRFIYGAGNNQNPLTPNAIAPWTEGGTTSHTHGAATQATMTPGGVHEHPLNIGADSTLISMTVTTSGATVLNGFWNNGTYDNGEEKHTHTITAATQVASASNMPPWLALCFIMKTV